MSKPGGPAVNACSLCGPLGASLAFMGVEGCVPLLHGSQGCATYIRRYLISHFREPVDIASSGFDEASVVFGGKGDLLKAIRNVEARYRPRLIGVASTCLSETIGDDVQAFIREFRDEAMTEVPLVCVSSASYRSTHADGFRDATLALVKRFCAEGGIGRAAAGANLFAGMASPEDLRHLVGICASFGIRATVVPDYSKSLDGQSWGEYRPEKEGGTPVADIARCGSAMASIEFFPRPGNGHTPGSWLEAERGIPLRSLGFPLGLRAADDFMEALSALSGRAVPEAIAEERGRLVDAYVDGHKYLYGVKAAIVAREELAASIAEFCSEVGMEVVLCAATGRGEGLADELERRKASIPGVQAMAGIDYERARILAAERGAELLIGTGKLYPAARSLDIPLIRLDFPIHDRFGGQRVLSAGYRGTQRLLDAAINALLERKQARSPIGYAYL